MLEGAPRRIPPATRPCSSTGSHRSTLKRIMESRTFQVQEWVAVAIDHVEIGIVRRLQPRKLAC